MSESLENLENKNANQIGKKNHGKLILILAYFFVWTLSLVSFWFFTDPGDALGYGFIFHLILIPGITLFLSLIIGLRNYWGVYKWLSAVVFGIMYMLAEYTTFSLANMLAFDKLNFPHFSMIIQGAIIALAGLALGTIIRRGRAKT